MRRIKLIVTGDMERKALVDSLRSFFPPEVDGEDVSWDKDPRKVNEVTTHRLPNLPAKDQPNSAMRLLASALIEEAISGKKKDQKPADLVIAICDVELGNLGRESTILAHFRCALEHGLERHELATRARYRDTLRQRCSFHLLRPMAEAVFFGDPLALERAGVAPAIPPRRRRDDVEEFECIDPSWVPECLERNQHKARLGLPWWDETRHPKSYLEHLVRRSGNKVYDEIEQGVSALATLSWPTVTNTQPSPFLRALFDDLASWFKVPNPLGPGAPSPLTSLTPSSPPNRWLRNL